MRAPARARRARRPDARRRGSRCSASCSASTCRTRRRPPPSTSASCASAWPRSRCSSSCRQPAGPPTMLVDRGRPVPRRGDARPAAAAVAGRVATVRQVLVVTRQGAGRGLRRERRTPSGRRRRHARARPAAARGDASTIIEAATEDDSAAAARGRGDRPTVRAATRCSSSSSLEPSGRPGSIESLPDSVEALDRRRDRPARPDRPDDPALRLGARDELRSRDCSWRPSATTSTSTTRSGTGSRTSSDPSRTREAAVPEHAHPRRRLRGPAVSPPARAARAGRRDDRGERRRVRSTRRSRRSRSTTTRPSAGTRRGRTAGGRRPGDGGLRERRGGAVLRAGARPRVAGCGPSMAPDLAELYDRRRMRSDILGEYDDGRSGAEAARRLIGDDPVEAAPLVVKQAIITSRTGRYRQSTRSADARPACARRAGAETQPRRAGPA